jgi:hypothetical protein
MEPTQRVTSESSIGATVLELYSSNATIRLCSRGACDRKTPAIIERSTFPPGCDLGDHVVFTRRDGLRGLWSSLRGDSQRTKYPSDRAIYGEPCQRSKLFSRRVSAGLM